MEGQSLANDLERSVRVLAGDIGERNVYRMTNLVRAATWIESELRSFGYRPARLPYAFPAERHEKVGSGSVEVWNIEAVLAGTNRPEETIIVGAHYDSRVGTADEHRHRGIDPRRPGTPGADDNASGVAAVLALARHYAGQPQGRTIRFVFFVNEEQPFFQTPAMGSWVYARTCASNQTQIVAMFTPETLGVYSEQPRRKRHPLGGILGLPSATDYVTFLSNWSSHHLVRRAARAFARASSVPLRTVSYPTLIRRVGWSDDWSFWQMGYAAFAVTDTAFMRHDHYHEVTDVPERLDYPVLARVVQALSSMLGALANEE